MSASLETNRGRFQGVAEILAFNWHWYALGGLGAIVGTVILQWVPLEATVRAVAWFALGVGVLWAVGSLAVSHWIYDRSPLRKWEWIKASLPQVPQTWCNIHCGLDESSAALRGFFPGSRAEVLDIFDPREMTEPSIARARQRENLQACTATSASYLPLADEYCDAVFLLFAAHELRSPEGRERLLKEVRRILAAGGCVVVAEHLRDGPNFCAFGPGAFHFYPRREWLRVFEGASLTVTREFSITPFVRIFVLRRAP